MDIADFIFPKNCLGCGRVGSYFCSKCATDAKNVKQVCIECTRPSIDGKTHIKCLRPLGLDGCLSIWDYEGVVRKVLIKLKYKFAFDLAKDLSFYASEFLKHKVNALPKNAILIPIPLHNLRKRWRGFNQADEIGKLIAANVSWLFEKDVLIRKVYTKPQTELEGGDRKKNLRGAFSLNPKYKLLSTNYIIFDDVTTTGSTLKEAVKVLKRNGAGKVWSLTIAR